MMMFLGALRICLWASFLLLFPVALFSDESQEGRSFYAQKFVRTSSEVSLNLGLPIQDWKSSNEVSTDYSLRAMYSYQPKDWVIQPSIGLKYHEIRSSTKFGDSDKRRVDRIVNGELLLRYILPPFWNLKPFVGVGVGFEILNTSAGGSASRGDKLFPSRFDIGFSYPLGNGYAISLTGSLGSSFAPEGIYLGVSYSF